MFGYFGEWWNPFQRRAQIAFHIHHESAGKRIQVKPLAELRGDDDFEQSRISCALPLTKNRSYIRLGVRRCKAEMRGTSYLYVEQDFRPVGCARPVSDARERGYADSYRALCLCIYGHRAGCSCDSW